MSQVNSVSHSSFSSNHSLQPSLGQLQATLEALGDGILSVDLQGKITNFNRKFTEIWNLSDREVAIALETQDFPIAAIQRQLQNPNSFSRRDLQTISARCKLLKLHDGRILEASSTLKTLGGETIGQVWTFRDITERYHSEQKLQRSLKELSDIKFALDRSAIVAITDSKGRITDVNDKFCELSQYSRAELLGRDHRIINSGYHSPEFFQNLWQTISSGRVWNGEIKNRAKDGTDYWVDTTIVPFLNKKGKPRQYLAIRSDITERKRAEEALRKSESKLRQKTKRLKQALSQLKQTQTQLVHSEKMSGLGQLVAGVAHEINNPVSFIYGNLSHARGYVEDLLDLIEAYECGDTDIEALKEEIEFDFIQTDILKLFDSMQMGADRIGNIVRSLRSFSHLDESEWKAVDLNRGIDNTLSLLQYRLNKNEESSEIQVIKHYGDLPRVECYAAQLNQVFMNLIDNAIDAVRECSDRPGCITIQTGMKQSDRVFIQISDNGNGIPRYISYRVFDPFFTTKPIGKGTGLGLSISYQIIRQHGGELHLNSEPGKGTTFEIVIPLRSH